MKIKVRIFLIVLLGFIIWAFDEYMPGDRVRIRNYDKNIFYPYQSARGLLFGHFPFSAGDVIYIIAGISVLILIARWIFFAFTFRREVGDLVSSFLGAIATSLLVYFIFILSWGANYYKPPLSESWLLDLPSTSLHLKSDSSIYDAELATEYPTASIRRAHDSAALVAFDSFLVKRLNAYAPHYRAMSFNSIAKRSSKYYRLYTDSKVKESGLEVKPSLFASYMERLGIEGYYNPFTGEGQVNAQLPAFTLPFLVCHEMAHQAGIAAEGDANLLAYTLCTDTKDSSFHYSAYLNIWLYTNNRLHRFDSARAGHNERLLNKLTRAHLDSLEELSRKYHNDMARYSSELFDSYLKMHDQKEGIRSYSDVIVSAWRVEQRRVKNEGGLIEVP